MIIKESSELEYKKASFKELTTLLNFEDNKLVENINKSEIMCEGEDLFLVIEGIAYPAEELAERLPNKLNI